MRLRYTVDALNHLEAINDFVAERNPAAARRIAADFRAAALRLCAFPQIGRIGQVPGTHEWVVHGSPYLYIYEVQDASNENRYSRRVSWRAELARTVEMKALE